MVFKEILAPVITLEHDQAALTAAAEIAHAHGTRATALIVTVDLASAFAEHTAPFSEIMLDLAKGSRSHAAVQRGKILAWIESAPHDFDVRDVTVEDAVEQNEVVAHARVADLVVIARADAHAGRLDALVSTTASAPRWRSSARRSARRNAVLNRGWRTQRRPSASPPCSPSAGWGRTVV